MVLREPEGLQEDGCLVGWPLVMLMLGCPLCQGVAGEPRLRKGSMPQAEPPPFHAYQGPNSELLPSCFPGKAFIWHSRNHLQESDAGTMLRRDSRWEWDQLRIHVWKFTEKNKVKEVLSSPTENHCRTQALLPARSWTWVTAKPLHGEVVPPGFSCSEMSPPT